MNDQTEDILDKIAQAHLRGEHSLGAFAGCSLCLPVALAPEPEVGISGDGPSPLIEQLISSMGGPEHVGRKVVAPIHAPEGAAAAPGDVEQTLGDDALMDAQEALDALQNLREQQRGHVSVEHAHALAAVGIVRALVGVERAIEQTNYLLARLVDVFERSDVEPPDLTTAPEPEPKPDPPAAA